MASSGESQPDSVIDLGDESIATFRLNGKEFECFVLDEIEYIHQIAMPEGGEPLKGIPFVKVLQDRLRDTHGISASLGKASEWYEALCKMYEEKLSFFEPTPASPDSTEGLPHGSAGDDAKSSKRSRKAK